MDYTKKMNFIIFTASILGKKKKKCKMQNRRHNDNERQREKNKTENSVCARI